MFLLKFPGGRRRKPDSPEPTQPTNRKSDLPLVGNLTSLELLALLLIKG